MFKNFENFIYSSEENFPKNECNVPSESEDSVFDSENTYMVLYIDTRFKNEKCITYAKPYIWKDEKGNFSFGWASTGSSQIFGNVENSCHFYNEFVIGFVKVNDNYIEEDEKFFNQYKETIDKYYNMAY